VNDKKQKFSKYIQEHISEIGIASIIIVMIITVIAGMSGRKFDFEPDDLNEPLPSRTSDSKDRVGYDLSEDGKEGKEANSNSDRKQEKDESPEVKKRDKLPEKTTAKKDRVVLPDGSSKGKKPSGTIDAAIAPDKNTTGNNPSGIPSGPGDDSQPGNSGSNDQPGNSGSGNDDGPGGSGDNNQGGDKNPGGNEPPGGGEDQPGKNKYVVGDKEFDNEDDALSYAADHAGKNDKGQYFDGFKQDENGNYIPSYSDKDKFEGGENGDVAYDYTGDSSTFVVPEGATRLQLLRNSGTNDKVKTIVISKTVTEINTIDGSSFLALEKFVVSGDNPNYVSVDGVLYRRTQEGNLELCMVPAAKKEIGEWPEKLTAIRTNSFYCSKMERVEFPNTVTDIQETAFGESYVRTIVLPESVRNIENTAFSFKDYDDKDALHKIIVKSSVPPAVSSAAFYWMTMPDAPTTEIIVPDSADNKIYEDYLMSWGTVLEKRYKKDAVLQILKTEKGVQTHYKYYEEDGKTGFQRNSENSAFFWWDEQGSYRIDEAGDMRLVKCITAGTQANFTDVKFVSIDKGAFDGCSSLAVIRLPDSLKNMPEDAFANNKELRTIITYAPNPPAANAGAPEICGVFVKPAALADYQKAWGGHVRKILGTSDSYSALSSGIVFDTGNKRLLDIPSDLQSFSIGSYVTTIYKEAAKDNTALSAVTIPAKVTSVGANAFENCPKLASVTWQTSAPVPESCFEKCTGLRTFKASGAGNRLTSIGRRAFYGCRSLETVLYYSYNSGGTNYYYFPYLAKVGEEAFYGCESMKYAYLHTSVSDIGGSAFKGSGLTQAYWYTSSSVPESCFEGCEALATFGWGESKLTEVGARAFYGCVSLDFQALSLPETVKVIGKDAFEGVKGAKEREKEVRR